MKVRLGMSIFVAATLVFFAVMAIKDYMNGTIGTSSVTSVVVALAICLQFLTWGTDRKAQQDEMGKIIAAKSAKISYHILTVALFAFWIADRIVFVRKDDFGNLSLFLTLCFCLVLYPVVQLFYVRRFK
ncbi:hypothetical protein QJ48_13695 [Paenibacillus sp. A3]|uniref:hypothetical protein n=1 Tax=Paenibacillus sp. A3 TaxID=1337054 RepID=UPI0006D54DF8|nr:hypothetical protein [Paenibacillus sp. A3]KPV58993.1 hypothetical protein QJ48_13695 [Paenibacillus sp. A3]